MDYTFQKILLSKLNDDELQQALDNNKVCDDNGPVRAADFRKRVEANLSPNCRWPQDLDEMYSIGGKPIKFKGDVYD